MKTLPHPQRWLAVALLGALALSLTGCVGPWNTRQRHEASSVVQFLYAEKDLPLIEPQIPTLRLPLRVGVAFLPSTSAQGTSGFNEQQKTELMRRVSEQFRTLPFVQKIEIIPTTYLRPGGGFDNLDQLRALMGLDVVVLLAYDQIQSTTQTEAALAYWTIVGAYLVPAQRNATNTLMEAVVYDIPSRSLLFRAPGTSVVQNHSTLIRTDQSLQQASLRSLEEASAQMTASLAQEIERFKVRIKQEPDTVRIEHKPGYTGAGSLEGVFSALLLVALTAFAAQRRFFRRS